MSKVVVAYFSAIGTTARLAEKIADVLGGELHEIRPETPYTGADLDWRNKKSRSSVEMNDKSFRPAVANTLPDAEETKVLVVAFPIWWYVAPTIINTFLEQYDWTGTVIVPVATSGGSGMGNTVAELAPSCPGAVLKDGRRFESSADREEIRAWFDSLQIL